MKIKIVLLHVLVVFCIQTTLAWGGPIYNTVKMRPSELITILGNLTAKQKMVTHIACVDVRMAAMVTAPSIFE